MVMMPMPPDGAPRWFHQWYALSIGYFWIPCPLCGHHFGGHEAGDIGGLPSSIAAPGKPNTGCLICPDCTRAGLGTWPKSPTGRPTEETP